MAFYHIFMVDPYKLLVAGNAWNTIKVQLNLLFDPVVGGAPFPSTLEGAVVVYSNGVVAPAPNELLVYIMPPGKSVVALSPGGSPQTDPTADGFTNFRAGASEVYARNLNSPILIAKLAFHECMHNKLRLGQTTPNGPDALHNSQDGLGAATIKDTTPLTTRNMRTMSAAIQTPVPQWTAGIQLVLNGMHDSMSPFFTI